MVCLLLANLSLCDRTSTQYAHTFAELVCLVEEGDGESRTVGSRAFSRLYDSGFPYRNVPVRQQVVFCSGHVV